MTLYKNVIFAYLIQIQIQIIYFNYVYQIL